MGLVGGDVGEGGFGHGRHLEEGNYYTVVMYTIIALYHCLLKRILS
jgi:hypothetical protein